MAVRESFALFMNYLDFQAYVGIANHNSGFAATDEVLAQSHIQDAQEVLKVGCGIGVGSVYVVSKHGCCVMGVDISVKMLKGSRRRLEPKATFPGLSWTIPEMRSLNLPKA